MEITEKNAVTEKLRPYHGRCIVAAFPRDGGHIGIFIIPIGRDIPGEIIVNEMSVKWSLGSS